MWNHAFSLWSRHPNIEYRIRIRRSECQRGFCTVHVSETYSWEPSYVRNVQRVMNSYNTAQDPSQHQKWACQIDQADCTSTGIHNSWFIVTSHSDLVTGGHSSCHLGSLSISSSHSSTEHPLCTEKRAACPLKRIWMAGQKYKLKVNRITLQIFLNTVRTLVSISTHNYKIFFNKRN